MRIGFVADYLNSEYSECLVSGITTCCKEHDVDLIIYQIGKIKPDNTLGHDYQYMAISSQINEHNVDGIIISSGTQLHGNCSDEEEIRAIANNLDGDKEIHDNGDYSFVFNGLPEQMTQIREYKLSQKKGRIFYCVDAAKKLVYCVLIKNSHIETDKVR